MPGIAPFLEIEKMAEAAVAQHVFLDRPLEFIAAAMSALAETTIEFMRREPRRGGDVSRQGFEMLWAADYPQDDSFIMNPNERAITHISKKELKP